MQQRPMQGMWGRYALFLLISMGILVLHYYGRKFFAPDEQQQAEKGVPGAEKGAEEGETDEQADPEEQAPEGEKPSPDEPERPPDAPSDPEGATASAEEPSDTETKPPPPDAETADEEVAAEQSKEPPLAAVTLGSLDPDDPYRMLVLITSQGAAVVRIELNSHRELDDGAYLGHLVVEPAPPGAGCEVQVVGPGTPADKAGLQPGDTILFVNDQRVTGFRSLQEALAETKPGETIELRIDRDGQEKKLTATLTRTPLAIVQPEHAQAPAEVVRPENDPLSFLLTLHREDGKAEEQADEDDGEYPRLPDESLFADPFGLRTKHWELDKVVKSEAGIAEAAVFRKVLDKPFPLEITKTYRLTPIPSKSQDDPLHPAYHLNMEVTFTNLSDQKQEFAYQLDGPTGLPTEGAWYANKVGRGLFKGAGLRDFLVKFQNEGIESVGCPAIAKDDTGEPWRDKPVQYIGVDGQYFAVMMLPEGEIAFAQAGPIRVGEVTEKKWRKKTNTSSRLTSKTLTLGPAESDGQSVTHKYQIFAGPKRPELLAHYQLDDLVYYGWFGFVARPMRNVLHFFHDYLTFGNYGLAIILLTVLVRGCMFPISRKQALNARRMQELQPEIKKLAEKYKNDLEGRTKAQQELFRKHNFHPLSGCWVLFLQLPIFIGLYRSLMVDVELRQAPLFGEAIHWCSNLAAPDMLFNWSGFMPDWFNSGQGIFSLGPYFNLLPLLTVVLFLAQQKLFMPPPTDQQTAQQQKIMKFMMLFIGLLFYKVASGLCIYFIASSLWGMAERKLLPKSEKKTSPPGSSAKSKPARPAPKPAKPAAQPSSRQTSGGNGAPARKKKRKRSRGRR